MRQEISAKQIAEQKEIMAKMRTINDEKLNSTGVRPVGFIDTYGCQQNEADSERLSGMLTEMGFSFTDEEENADVILINTCAVREHAEMRVLGNVGALTHTKRARPGQIICLCGCMVQQEHMADKIKNSFRHVDLVFGPHALWKFPELLYTVMTEKGRVFSIEDSPGAIAEGLPVYREKKTKAWVSIMYGCNNFCSYCVVPYVRGRERSRMPEDILEEVRNLVGDGCRDITLLGQNVNSYGKDLEQKIDFSKLLEMINDLEGDFLIRFMTSHPKDASCKLFDTMARCKKVARHLHLPFQAGNDRVLREMNRGYTASEYLDLIDYARSVMPDIVLTSDVIVGFPGETDKEFEDTLRLIETVRFDALFTFIYSPRSGTPAAQMEDPFTREDKQRRFDRLLEAQNQISAQRHEAYVGKNVRVLVDGLSGDERYNLSARTNGNRLVRLSGSPDMVGCFIDVSIIQSNTWSLIGQLVQE